MQHTSQLLMIQPVNFGFNTETAVNNTFQHPTGNVQEQALQEFIDFVALLRSNKIDVTVIADTAYPVTPDSIFPNNWISFHQSGQVFLYPMFAANRRLERKPDILERIQKEFVVENINDLTHYEINSSFLEGTGSIVFDRDNKIAYACLSARTDRAVLEDFCSRTDHTAVVFIAEDNAQAIYHTNVMMCVADKYAVVCLDAITEGKEELIAALDETNKVIIEISLDQVRRFAGNMLQLINTAGEVLLVMSSQAYYSLTAGQLSMLNGYNRILHSPLDHIETAGGGSARCMMAEVFLEKKKLQP